MDKKNSSILYFVLGIFYVWLNGVAAINCPTECYCGWKDGKSIADCSDKALTSLPTFEDFQFDILDISNNYFTELPPGLHSFESLEELKAIGNQITKLRPGALEGLTNLRLLLLDNNNITSLEYINPTTEFITYTPQLYSLSLSGNPITVLNGANTNQYIVSESLRILDFSYCKINKITSDNILQGLPALEHFFLQDNPIKTIPSIVSENLLSIDISNARLSTLEANVFTNLPSLAYLNLAKNSKISLMGKPEEYVQSESLRRIDLSYCNMDKIELHGFPNLVSAILKGNMIRQLDRDSFLMNPLIEKLDLSFNAISSIEPNTFMDMKRLKHLDLSFNIIPRINKDTFTHNEMLTTINLSRNYISRLNRISASTLAHLNMSWCEIISIDIDAFHDLPAIRELDLSNNLISAFPDSLSSDTLQTIDLSMCRLSSIRNETFRGFPELSELMLAGNRFTTTFRVEFFEDNPYLRVITLGDNPWRCDCLDKSFFDLFNFLTEHPAKIGDRSQMRCNSPDTHYGRTWEHACAFTWYPPMRSMSTAEKVWTFMLITVIMVCSSICIVMCVKRCIHGRKLTRRERERADNMEEMRSIRQYNQIVLQQEAMPNAPDARESKPPCYEDALKLPRLDGSFASLTELGNARMKRKSQTNGIANGDAEPSIRRNRCRSEETISMRDSNVVSMRRSTRRTTRLPAGATEINSVENIRQFQSEENSPYSQRRTARENVAIQIEPQIQNDISSLSSEEDRLSNTPDITIVENHYNASASDTDSRNTEDEYATFSKDEIQSTGRVLPKRGDAFAEAKLITSSRREQSPKIHESDF